MINIHEELFHPGSLKVNPTDLGAFEDLVGAKAGLNKFDPIADEEPREQQPERASSSHGASYSVLGLNFDSQVQYKLPLTSGPEYECYNMHFHFNYRQRPP